MSNIFVFGSNLQGRHGAGAARTARLKYGAVYGIGEGRQGNSYALPTKAAPYKDLPLNSIHKHAENFKTYAMYNPRDVFLLTAVGTGLAGRSNETMASLFVNAPRNVLLPRKWWGFSINQNMVDDVRRELSSREDDKTLTAALSASGFVLKQMEEIPEEYKGWFVRPNGAFSQELLDIHRTAA